MTTRTRFLSALTLTVTLVLTMAPAVAAASEEGGGEGGWGPSIAKFVNFVILFGLVGYFLKGPIAGYLNDRKTTIQRDLTDAKALRATAEQQLAQVKSRLAELPAELEALKRRGVDELAAEKTRLADATAAERARVLEQTRREIETQSRMARRELVEHGANLSVKLARQRIEQGITPADQARLIESYKPEAIQ
jgi:F-type H+-transporting ATPase subunit b